MLTAHIVLKSPQPRPESAPPTGQGAEEIEATPGGAGKLAAGEAGAARKGLQKKVGAKLNRKERRRRGIGGSGKQGQAVAAVAAVAAEGPLVEEARGEQQFKCSLWCDGLEREWDVRFVERWFVERWFVRDS